MADPFSSRLVLRLILPHLQVHDLGSGKQSQGSAPCLNIIRRIIKENVSPLTGLVLSGYELGRTSFSVSQAPALEAVVPGDGTENV